MKEEMRSHVRLSHSVLRSSALLFGTSVVALWAWNAFAPELLALEPMRFKHAFGLILFVTVIGRCAIPQRLTGHGATRSGTRCAR